MNLMMFYHPLAFVHLPLIIVAAVLIHKDRYISPVTLFGYLGIVLVGGHIVFGVSVFLIMFFFAAIHSAERNTTSSAFLLKTTAIVLINAVLFLAVYGWQAHVGNYGFPTLYALTMGAGIVTLAIGHIMMLQQRPTNRAVAAFGTFSMELVLSIVLWTAVIVADGNLSNLIWYQFLPPLVVLGIPVIWLTGKLHRYQVQGERPRGVWHYLPDIVTMLWSAFVVLVPIVGALVYFLVYLRLTPAKRMFATQSV